MEPDFDKEIDALLRRETVGRTITISEFAGGLHLDADEITAFAEKKVPPGVRDSFIEHFAACDRCRKVLLNAAWLNAEEEPAVQPAIAAPASMAAPWYRRLLLFPNQAYALGGLVILFAGFIGLSVVFNSFLSPASQVSRVEFDQVPSASGPSDAIGTESAANTNASSTAMANSSFNSASNTSVANTSASYSANRPASESPSGNTVAAQAPKAEVETQRSEPAATAGTPTRRVDISADGSPAGRVVQGRPPPQAAPVEKEDKAGTPKALPISTPAMRANAAAANERREDQAAEADLAAKKVERVPAPPSGGSSTFVFRKKQVSGRTFELRQGAWYDTSYRGQGTVNVRRNSEAYRKLDRGLRGIAEGLIGTVVTVWNGKAYRIE